jgi:hypothetical protein
MRTKQGVAHGSAVGAGIPRTMALDGTSNVVWQVSQVVRTVVVVILASGPQVAAGARGPRSDLALSLTCPASVTGREIGGLARVGGGADGQRTDSATRQRDRVRCPSHHEGERVVRVQTVDSFHAVQALRS